MKSQFKAGKLFLVGSLVLLSSLVTPVVSASAVTTNTNTNTIVPNTQVCPGGPTTKYVHGGAFTVVWNHDNTFTITVTKAFSYDVKLFASSYHLTNPAYNGGCFVYNSATSPQTWDQNTQTITLPCNWTGIKTVTVVLPEDCYNEQVDLYFGDRYGNPLNGTVGARGHDNYGWIAGNIMLTANNPACNQPVPPVQPPVTPPTVPQVLGASTTKPAAQLTDTGLPVAVTSTLGAGLLASAIFVARKKSPALDGASL